MPRGTVRSARRRRQTRPGLLANCYGAGMVGTGSRIGAGRGRAPRFAPAFAFVVVAAGLAAPRAALAQTTEARDVVVLSSGKELRGRVVRVDAKNLVLRVGSVDRTIARDDVKSIDSVAQKHRDWMAAWQKTDLDDTHALLALASEAERVGLKHEARLVHWLVAVQRPADATVHKVLGNREVRGAFQVEIDGKWVPFDKADALGEDFANAWRLRSEHFTIRCAGGLRLGVTTLLELEGFYWLFQDLFGAPLQLFELVEPIEVRLYRSREQMPNLANTVGAYFSVDEPALITYAERDRAAAIEHEGTHALLYFFCERAAKSRGELPSWLDEGWAEYMDGRVQTRVPGKPVLLARSVMADLSAVLAELPAADRYGVHRLLNFKSSDFGASSRQREKYAQSWALFRYLFEHPDAAVRDQFTEYLREAVAGRGQASTFRRIFARMEKQLETEPWRP
jgi:hypothetical protein